jgi:hypothetical protein
MEKVFEKIVGPIVGITIVMFFIYLILKMFVGLIYHLTSTLF